MKKLSVILIALVMVSALSGCETTEGAGRDLQKAGEKIEDAAN